MGRPTEPRMGQYVRNFLFLAALAFVAVCLGPVRSDAAPYAAYVMDARTGETLYSENADTRLYPASLTKMMTLYITFTEIEAGRLSLDTMVTVSKNAASMPPSRLGLKAGQQIQLRYLIRAAAVKSANDAAAAIGDYIAGSPEKFGARMTRTAKALGMNNSIFKNANGLTAAGHVSTAHDMSILGRHLFYDFPQYYSIFSRRSIDAGLATVANTNRKFLDMYKGADGIKTGYTAPAGFNLTASAERDGVRIIATIFGGTSPAMRNGKMAELMDLGFKKARHGVVATPPTAPVLPADELLASAAPPAAAIPFATDSQDEALPVVADGAGKTIRIAMAVDTSPRPAARPVSAADAAAAAAAMADDMAGHLAAAATALVPAPNTLDAQAAGIAPDAGTVVASDVETVSAQAGDPLSATVAVEDTTQQQVLTVSAAPAAMQTFQLVSSPRPPKRKAPIYDDPALVVATDDAVQATEVVTRISTSGGEGWGINVGRYNTHGEAEKVLMKTLLIEDATLANSLRKVVQKSGAFDADFLGLSQDQADLACRRLQARGVQCFTMGP